MSSKMNLRTVTKYISATTLALIWIGGTQSVYACAQTPFLGQLCTVAFNFCPTGWTLANGQLLPINQNQALFALLGTQFGGNGTTNFALPNLQGRVPVGAGTGAGQTVVIGEQFGAPTTTLTTSQLPSHTHSFNVNTTIQTNMSASTASGAAIGPSATNNYLGTATGTTKIYTSTHSNLVPLGGVTGTAAISGNTNATGGGQPIATQPPSLGITYCIALQGIFPSQN